MDAAKLSPGTQEIVVAQSQSQQDSGRLGGAGNLRWQASDT